MLSPNTAMDNSVDKYISVKDELVHKVDKMTTNTTHTEKRRNDYRRLANQLHLTGKTRDLYAAFMVDREQEQEKEFSKRTQKKWARRFKAGAHYDMMDSDNKKRLLRLMTESIDGTAPAFQKEDVKNVFVDMLADQEQKVAVSVLEEIGESIRLEVTVSTPEEGSGEVNE